MIDVSFFDPIARTYDEWYEKPLGRFVDEVETRLALELFQPKPGMYVLDVGCGTGNFSIKLAKLGVKVVGIDISEEMLKIARKKAKRFGLQIEFAKMDVYSLKFPSDHFDGVFSMASFEFIREPKRAFDEMMRVLKPSGLLLIGTINKDSPWGGLYEQQAKQDPTSVFRYASFKTEKDLEELDPKNLVRIAQCVFIPPNASEEQLNWDEERRLSKTQKGGFIIALWRKPS
ncbi:class I SAM-dependent methyltransferase [Pseudothermotoga sp.]